MSLVLDVRILLVWIALVCGVIHMPPVSHALSCHSCAGSGCPRHISEEFGRCSVSDEAGKCFIRVDPNGMMLWGCATPRRWSIQDLRRDGCRLFTQAGFGGKMSIVCLCSDNDLCNSYTLGLVAKYPNKDSHQIVSLLQKQYMGTIKTSPTVQGIRNIFYATINPMYETQARSRPRAFHTHPEPTALVKGLLNDVSKAEVPKTKELPRISTKYSGKRQSYTIPEKMYNMSPYEVNNVVHGMHGMPEIDGHGPFIPKYRDCRIHNGYCEHVCVMSWNGMGFCTCHDGFQLSRDLMNCDDVDECEVGNGACEHTCHNTKGDYYCTCHQGYSMADNNSTCHEIDECGEPDQGGCSHQCTNTPGSYACGCPSGFHLMEDGWTCEDTDECLNETALCQQLCNNTQGSYKCHCTLGFTLHTDGHLCMDEDECLSANGGCNQECINSLGSYACGCRMGYDFANDTTTCVDINECEEENGHCGHYCTNEEGTYNCSCALGYQLMSDMNGCLEVVPGDKCIKDNGGCDHHCATVDASTVTCTCDLGYKLLSNQKACTDVDECALSPCEGECVNTPGSYSCMCVQGYSLQSDGACRDINECHKKNAGCDDTCINTDGSYFCACALGYWLGQDGHQCIDIDECQMSNGGCVGICENSPGSYNCSCAPGYEMDIDGKSCYDLDECSSESYGGCEQICVNTAGSYICGCADGYRLAEDHMNCDDRDECSHYNGGCDQQCTNFRGSFECDCYHGYARDYLGVCRDVDECLYGLHNCTVFCRNTLGDFQCECLPGYILDTDRATCLDDNECLNENGECEQYCTNSPGSYSCTCAEGSGFTLADDGKSCYVRCPELFQSAPDARSCLLLVTDKRRNFEDAEEYCRSYHAHAHLISLEGGGADNQLVQLFDKVEEVTKDKNNTLWTAGRFWHSVGDYVWITSFNVISGLNITSEFDVTSQNERCITATSQDEVISLRAQDCDVHEHFMCEIKIGHN